MAETEEPEGACPHAERCKAPKAGKVATDRVPLCHKGEKMRSGVEFYKTIGRRRLMARVYACCRTRAQKVQHKRERSNLVKKSSPFATLASCCPVAGRRTEALFLPFSTVVSCAAERSTVADDPEPDGWAGSARSDARGEDPRTSFPRFGSAGGVGV
jgi:hypothetical protein